MNVTKKELFNMIEALRERLDRIEGRPRGPITMTDLRLACQRGDKSTIHQYWEQFKKENRNGDDLRKRVERPRAEPTNGCGPVMQDAITTGNIIPGYKGHHNGEPHAGPSCR
jgi:hypothetical protein